MSEEVEQDPFAPENIGIVNFIMMGRIYDVLFTILQDTDSEAASRLFEAHSKGYLIGPPPDFNGEFLSN